jgi:hypothetical protein
MILRQCTREPASLGLIVRYCIPYLALTYADCKRRWKDRYQIHEGRRDREQRTSKTVLEIKDNTRETRISVATPVLRKTSHPLSRHMCSPQSRAGWYVPNHIISPRETCQRLSSPHLCRALTSSSVRPALSSVRPSRLL